MQFDEFDHRLKTMLHQIPEETFISLEQLKTLDEQQKEAKKESLKAIKHNF